jgi:hypothetical protein
MTRLAGFLVAAILIFGSSTSARAVQEPPPANGIVEGIVSRIGTNEPLGKASVELRGPQNLVLTTESDGKFRFEKLRAGSYRLVVRRDGFWPAEYEQRWVDGPGQAITLGPNQNLSGAKIVLTPVGIIAGRIASRSGQPMAGARVRAMKPTIRENQRALRVVQETIANDLGEYRLSSLIPGRYYISAAVVDTPPSGVANLVVNADAAAEANPSRSTPRPVTAQPPGNGLAEDQIYAPIFFPAVADSRQALPVDIDPGVEYRAADIFVFPIHTFHVRGTVANLTLLPGAQNPANAGAEGARGAPPAAPAQNAPRGRGGAGGANQVRLAPLDPNGSTYNAQIDATTGAFDFQRVVPGLYVAYMFVSGLTVRAAQPVEVGSGDVNGVFLDVSPGIEIPVRVRFDGEPPQNLPNVSSLPITLWRDPTLMQAPSMPMTNNPAPAIRNLALGDYRVYSNPLLNPINGTEPLTRNNWPNAYIKSIRLGDVDVLNGGLHLDARMDTVTKLMTQAQEAAADPENAKPPELVLDVLIGANPGAVQGRVVNENQEGQASLMVTLFADSVHNRILRTDMYKVTSTDASGRFEVLGLPPGEYKIFAWDGIERGAWLDPLFTAGFESAGKTIRVEEGRIEAIELNPVRVR